MTFFNTLDLTHWAACGDLLSTWKHKYSLPSGGKCVVIKCMLQSSRLEDHMKNIGIDQSLYIRSSFEHKCMNNIKKIYQHAGKCDDQQNLKDIIDAAILSTPERVTDTSPNVHMSSKPVKKTK